MSTAPPFCGVGVRCVLIELCNMINTLKKKETSFQCRNGSVQTSDQMGEL